MIPSREPRPGAAVTVGLSGGVDSAVAALLLRRQGYQVSGVFMKNWEDDDSEDHCPARADFIDAVAVAERIGIQVDAVSFAAEYRERVFASFLRDLGEGRTPNPDVVCNREVKFKLFLDHALARGAERIATGHYARIARQGGRYRLLKGVDRDKDQSYFLYTLAQAELGRGLFPLGGLTKPEVRRLAREAGLSVHDKRDSTGICFIGERPFQAFLARYLAPRPGEIRTVPGKTVGEHPGVFYFTLGQRAGLRIGGVAGAAESPWYVVAKDLDNDILVVAQGHAHPLLMSRALTASELSWVAGTAPALPCVCRAKTRYRQPDQACAIVALEAGRAQVVFEEPQRAVTPGQAVVFYQGEECLGGGTIASTERLAPSPPNRAEMSWHDRRHSSACKD